MILLKPLKIVTVNIKTYLQENTSLIWHLCSLAGYITVQIIQLMQEIKIKNDPIASLNKLKATYFSTFLDLYKEIAGERIAASSLCSVLSVAIESAVIETLPDDIVDKMKLRDPSFKTKRSFKVKILKDQARKDDFNLYITYISDIRSSFKW